MLQPACERKEVSEYATSWMVSLLRRLGVVAERYCTVVAEPSVVALKTATLLAAPFVELVLHESLVGEHAIKGVAESAMREVNRQTRTLKICTGKRMWERSSSPTPS